MLKTPCHEWHQIHHGRMVDFAGWEMPIQYSSITEEHHAVRRSAGLFDIAHMGRLFFTGPDACKFLDHIVTNSVASMKPGQVRYALVCNERGGVEDDVLVYRFDDFYMLVVNASNREKIVAWIESHRNGFDFQMEDATATKTMIAIQGPKSAEILQPLCVLNLSELGYYRCATSSVLNHEALLSRTGYTGEDGFEVIVDAEHAVGVWEAILKSGESVSIQPCGLGCRDTLRLEAAMPLYGHELNDTTDPLTAGLNFAIKLKKDDFIGKSALVAVNESDGNESTAYPVRVGLEIEGRRIAREHSKVLNAVGETIGEVTSGTFSPTLEKVIGMAYVPAKLQEPGTPLSVDLRGKPAAATVVPLPFYKRADS